MSASEYRAKAAASLEACLAAPTDALRLELRELVTSWSWLAKLADWQEAMRLKGHLPD